jgi:hypothetical protein
MRALHPVGSFWSSSRGSCCGVLLLVLVLAGTACAPLTGSSSAVVSPTETVRLRSPRQLAASAWEQVALPAPAADIHGAAVSPADPAILFACTAQLVSSEPSGDTPPQPLTLWRTADAGAHWTRYAPAFGAGTECLFSIATDQPKRVTLQVSQSVAGAQPCAQDTFYLSGDSGVTWHPLPPHTSIAPAHAYYGWCDLHVTARHLFLDYSYSPAFQAPQVSLLERSDDDGVTWTRADRGLGDGALFSMPEIGPGDTLAVTVIHLPAQIQMPPVPAPTTLWMSTNAGNTWWQVSTLLAGAGTFLLTALPPRASTSTAWPAPDHPFYALELEQIPSGLYRERALVGGAGPNWTLLPPLPVSGVSPERPGILQALGVLPDGRLAVWGPDPQGGIPAPGILQGQVPTFWVWLWDPATQQWQVVPSPLMSPASEGCGLCWWAQTAMSRGGVSYLYVARFDSVNPGITLPGLFRMRLPTGT